MGKKNQYLWPTHTKSLPDHLGNACLFSNSEKKKITILLTKVPQIIHFVICKVQQSTVTLSHFILYELT